MKEKIKKLLKRCPSLYNLANRLYASLSNPYIFAERIVCTKAREREWATRHLRKGNDWGNKQHFGQNDEWVLSYWESQNHPHRTLLLDKIAEFSRISSVLEIGCNCGPNLHLLAQKYPDIMIRGIDINPIAVETENRYLSSGNSPNVHISLGRADDLSQFQDKTFDVVFTDAVLIYIGPDKIQQTIQEMIRVARKGLVLVERHCFEPNNRDNYGLGSRPYGLWQRDYRKLLKELAPQAQIQITKITKDMWHDSGWQETGAVIEVVL